MKQLISFTKKEFMEYSRTNKLLIITIISVLFGIVSPAIAKLTPTLMNLLSDSLAGSGLFFTNVDVNAMTSWTQYYKNVPMVFIIFGFMFSGTLTNEYQKGTLINIITKGLLRWKIIVSKSLALYAIWSMLYWICFAITYGYNSYFWDNSIADNIFFSAFCLYLIGILLISLIILMSTIFNNNSTVLVSIGIIFTITYIVSFIPKIKKFLPTQLLTANNALTNITPISDYIPSIIITVILFILCIIVSIINFNKKSI